MVAYVITYAFGCIMPYLMVRAIKGQKELLAALSPELSVTRSMLQSAPPQLRSKISDLGA